MNRSFRIPALLALGLTAFCLTIPVSSARGGVLDRLTGGFRTSFVSTDNKEKFQQVELTTTARLPWSLELGPAWTLHAEATATAGTITGAGVRGFIASAGPSLALSRGGRGLSLDIGVNATHLDEYRFGTQDLGGPFQFVSHVRIRAPLDRHLRIGYQFQHMSNAGIRSQNPGLNLHMIELSYEP
jgi:hypothetical protein